MNDSTTPPAWPLAVVAGVSTALLALGAVLWAPYWARRLAARGLRAMPDTLADLGGDD